MNDIHGDIVLLKRIFNDILASSKKISFKQNENRLIDKDIWNNINNIIEFYFKDFYARYMLFLRKLYEMNYWHPDKIEDIKIRKLFEEVQRCYYEEDIEELINASQELFREVRNKLFTKEDEESFIRVWIKIYSIIFEISDLVDLNAYDAIKKIDDFLGRKQKQICHCMLKYTQKEYDNIIRQNGHIKKFLWYLRCNKEIKAEYITKLKGMRCYSLMWSEKERINYFALSGGSRVEKYYGDLLMKLVQKPLNYEQVMLNDNVRYYYNYKDYITYREMKIKKFPNIKKFVSCCERKLLTKITDLNNKYHIFIKFKPCEQCKMALYDYDPHNQIDIISPKKRLRKNKRK